MTADNPNQIVEKFLEFLETEYDISGEDLQNLLAKRDAGSTLDESRKRLLVPLEAFSSELGAYETIVKFLRDAYSLSYSEISMATGRSASTVRGTYRNATRKRPGAFDLAKIGGEALLGSRPFPASLLGDKALSVFEHLVLHLSGQNLRLKEIAAILGRDSRTVWTIKDRALRKRADEGGEGNE